MTQHIEYPIAGQLHYKEAARPIARQDKVASFTLGAGRSSWQIDATARGRLGASVSAQTEAVADGWDRFGFVGGDYRGFKWPISWRYQRGVLNADNRVTLNAFQLALRRPL
jgi:hypothetical protein